MDFQTYINRPYTKDLQWNANLAAQNGYVTTGSMYPQIYPTPNVLAQPTDWDPTSGLTVVVPKTTLINYDIETVSTSQTIVFPLNKSFDAKIQQYFFGIPIDPNWIGCPKINLIGNIQGQIASASKQAIIDCVITINGVDYPVTSVTIPSTGGSKLMSFDVDVPIHGMPNIDTITINQIKLIVQLQNDSEYNYIGITSLYCTISNCIMKDGLSDLRDIMHYIIQATTQAATQAATEAATQAATQAATEAATQAATQAATEAATQAATEAATQAATQAATEAATQAATQAATAAATQAATQAATEAATQAATAAATQAATEPETTTTTTTTTEGSNM